MADITLDALAAFQAEMNKMPAYRARLIASARDAGHSWREIGDVMGMSHAGAIKAARAGTDPVTQDIR